MDHCIFQLPKMPDSQFTDLSRTQFETSATSIELLVDAFPDIALENPVNKPVLEVEAKNQIFNPLRLSVNTIEHLIAM